MKQSLVKGVFIISLCVTLVFLLHCGKKPRISASAPDFTLKTLEDKEIALSGLKGKVVLLDFWATWCGQCREAIPHLTQIYKIYQEKEFETIGMNMDRGGTGIVRNFVKSMDIPYPIIITPDDVARNFGVTGLPTTVFIDKEGKIREKIVGFNSAIAQKIAAKVAELTSENP